MPLIFFDSGISAALSANRLMGGSGGRGGTAAGDAATGALVTTGAGWRGGSGLGGGGRKISISRCTVWTTWGASARLVAGLVTMPASSSPCLRRALRISSAPVNRRANSVSRPLLVRKKLRKLRGVIYQRSLARQVRSSAHRATDPEFR